MIVPRTRLLVWFTLLAVPFATLAGVEPNATIPALAMIAAFLVVGVVDAVLAANSLRGVEMELPRLVRATQGRPFAIEVRVRNPSLRARKLRLALAFPPDVVPTVREFTIDLPANSEWSAFDWPCSVLQRGNFSITVGRLEAASPIGFWSRWKTVVLTTEFRAYPSLTRERQSLAALFLNRGAFGLHAQRQVGRGREFEKLREYIPGDGFEDVHWKATAKRGHPVTKVFQIERTQEVYVLIDSSRLSGRRVDGKTVHGRGLDGRHAPDPSWPSVSDPERSTILERFITAALVLGLAAEQQGDHFGLLTFSDKIENFLRARNGKAHYHGCRDALYALQPRDVSPDFDELSTFIRLRLRRRALLIFLTSLDDPVTAESFVRNMELIRRQHFVLVNMLHPPGARPLFSRASIESEPDIYGELAGHLRWHGLRELEKVLQRRGIRLSLIASERLAVDLVSHYLNVKQRQVL